MYTYNARLVSVTDGDTVRLDLDLGFYEWRLNQPYRLLRIDAPELNTLEGKETKHELEAFSLARPWSPKHSEAITSGVSWPSFGRMGRT